MKMKSSRTCFNGVKRARTQLPIGKLPSTASLKPYSTTSFSFRLRPPMSAVMDEMFCCRWVLPAMLEQPRCVIVRSPIHFSDVSNVDFSEKTY